MITLTYGYLKPEDGDIGDEIFDAFENNIDLVNAHDHDGINGAKINSSNISKLQQNIISAGWVSQGNGVYRQLVTILGSKNYDDLIMAYRDTDTDVRYFLEEEKVSDFTFYVYTNDNTKNITIYYL